MPAPIRARDVRSAVKELGFERGVIHVLELICEERAGDRQTMREIVEMMGQVVNNIDRMVQVGDAMGVQIQEIKRRDEQFRNTDQLPPSD